MYLVQFQLLLGLLIPSLHKQPSPLCSSWVTCPCFHSLWISFFAFRSLLSHASVLPSLPYFMLLGISTSYALWKTFLKTCQLWSAPLYQGSVYQGILLTIFLKSWKFAFLKFRSLTVLCTWSISLRTTNLLLHQCMITATQAASNLHVPLSFCMLVTIRSRNTFPLLGLSLIWLKKLCGTCCLDKFCIVHLWKQMRWSWILLWAT